MTALVRRPLTIVSPLALLHRGPLQGTGLLVFAFALQLGHVFEHILIKLRGTALIAAAADSEDVHFVFNSVIAVLAFALIVAYPRNVWVYPLALIATLHGLEHAYIYVQHVRTGIVNGPGLLGIGGAIGIVPLERPDLHNIYNGIEIILMTLGVGREVEISTREGVDFA